VPIDCVGCTAASES